MKYSILQNRSHENETEKPKSIFRRINILDVFLVLVLVAVLLLLATFFLDISIFGIGGEERDIAYTVELDGLTPEFMARVKKGDLYCNSFSMDVRQFYSRSGIKLFTVSVDNIIFTLDPWLFTAHGNLLADLYFCAKQKNESPA